ncbi:hypothetical protein D3C76_37160 [compost metagenome]
MKKIVPTQLSNYLQVSNFLGTQFEKKPNTTLNQKFDVQANAAVQPGMIPTLKGFTIGIGGHTYTMGANQIPLSQVIDHSSGDAGLYKHLPFVIRPMNDDLTTGERAKYFLRKIINVDNVNMIAYYGKRLNLAGVVPKMTKRTVVDDQTVIEDYEYTEANLSPVPPSIPNTGAVTTSNEYLATSALVPMPFTEKDVAELYNVAEVLFGDRRMAIISEFGFVTGIDADVSINTSAGAVNFKEVIAGQITAHISGHYELIFNSKGFDFTLEVGAVQPLLATGNIPTVTMSLLGG